MSEAKTKSKFPLWLIVSLLVNLLLVGFIVGGILRHKHGDDRRYHREPPRVERSDEDKANRKLVRETLRSAFAEARDERLAERAARKAIGEAIQADPFDREAVTDAFKAMREANQARSAVIDAALVQSLSEMDVSQRKAIAEMLSRDRGPGDRGKKKGGPDGKRPPPPDFDD